MNGLKKFGFEFLSIFIAVVSAFALNNWNENRKANNSENKILVEIANGLEKDLLDIRENKMGHQQGSHACDYFRQALTDTSTNIDTLAVYYLSLTRDFVSLQNTAAYETLKSKGLELIQNDSLRLHILSLYEYDYQLLRKLEEEYAEMQHHTNYFKDISKMLAPSFKFDARNYIIGMEYPLKISANEKKELLLILLNIQMNRQFALTFYADIESKVVALQKELKRELR